MEALNNPCTWANNEVGWKRSLVLSLSPPLRSLPDRKCIHIGGNNSKKKYNTCPEHLKNSNMIARENSELLSLLPNALLKILIESG